MRRGFSPAVMAAFVSTLLLLGIVGWSAGWVAAGNELQDQNDPTASPSVPKSTASSPLPTRTSPSPSPSPHGSPTGTPSRPNQFEMPNLTNKPFREARAAARAKSLGVNVVFNEPSSKPAGTVVKTLPDAGVFVWPGVTIQLYVSGPPPKVIVPEVLGQACHDGRDVMVEAGLKIGPYPSGERGTVKKTEPPSGTELNWNDEIKLYCTE